MDFKAALQYMATKHNIQITDQQAELFLKYKDILLDWNNKINLTAITDEKEIILKHFIDSLTIAQALSINNKTIIDIGTGAGFPGIPLKICYPQSKVLLLDSLNKRVNFLNHATEALNLKDISALHGRAEDFGKDAKHREKFDIAVSRAVSRLNILAEYILPFVKVGGYAIAMKGSEIDIEVTEAKKAIEVTGGKITAIKPINLEVFDGNGILVHNLVVIKKVRQTPLIYPRISNKISRQPIL